MAALYSAERFRFLFRQDRGVIDAPTWRSAVAPLAGLFALASLIEWLIDRNRTVNLITGTAAIFVLFTMLVVACYYFVSVKRFRDRGRAPSLALVLPVALFVATCLQHFQPATGGYYPLWLAPVAEVVLAGVAVWNVVELGFMDRPAQQRISE